MMLDKSWYDKMLEVDKGCYIPAGSGGYSEMPVPTVGMGEFAKRHKKDSTFTHFDGEWDELCDLVRLQLRKGSFSPSYRDGTMVVHMEKEEAKRFKTFDAYPMFEGMKLDAKWARVPGREHEPAKLQVTILEPKIPCNYVDVILYKKETLLEDKDDVTGADWDIVSINGRLKKNPPPIDSMTLVRNWLHLRGGTEMKGTTPEEMLIMLCDSILYKNGMKRFMSKKNKEN